MMKRKQKLLIVAGLGVLMIVFGVLKMIFDFDVNSSVVGNISLIIVIGAFGLLFNNSDKTDKNENNKNQQENNGLNQKL